MCVEDGVGCQLGCPSLVVSGEGQFLYASGIGPPHKMEPSCGGLSIITEKGLESKASCTGAYRHLRSFSQCLLLEKVRGPACTKAWREHYRRYTYKEGRGVKYKGDLTK